jgi:hypothetical protein
MTRKDCLAAPDKVPFAMTEWFRRYPMITTVTYFETEMHDQAPLLHLLPGDRWRTPIQLAQEQLARDCQLFASGKKTSLKLIQPDLTRLGY